MENSSTIGEKERENFLGQKLTIGLDLGDRSSHYCVLDEAGKTIDWMHGRWRGWPASIRTCWRRCNIEAPPHKPI